MSSDKLRNRIPSLIWAAPAAAAFLIACGGKEGGPKDAGSQDAGTGDAGGPAIEAVITEEPFAVDMSFQGKKLTSLSAPGRSAFYLTDGAAIIELRGSPQKKTEGGSTTYTYGTSDGRAAAVTVTHVPQGALRMKFSVDGKGKAEKLGAQFAVSAAEGFYGMMEKVVQGVPEDSWVPGMTQGLNLRGQEVFLFVYPTVSVYSPFYASSAGYGVWVESYWPGTYKFGKDDPAVVTLEYEGTELAIRVFPGPTPINAVERYSKTVGTTVLPPKWAFGPMRWRDEHFNLPKFYDGTPNNTPFNSMVAEDLMMIEHFGVKNSYYLVDRPWGPGSFGYDDIVWDEARFPNYKRMIEYIHEKGMKLVLWICPWAVGNLETEAVQKGYVINNPYALDPGKLLDLSNPEVVEWWQPHLIDRLYDGVDGFKMDRGDEKPPEGIYITGKYHDGMTYREGHNRYPVLYAAAVKGALDKSGRADIWAFERPAWTGTARHVTTYGGDIQGREWGLRAAIIAQQRSAAMNFPVWGSDTCGYWPQCDREVCMRWLAFSAFSPFMDIGPTANLGFWSRMPGGEIEKVFEGDYSKFTSEYDEGLIAAWIFYSNLHADLIDYSYAQAQIAHEDGTPITRPMIFMHPENPDYLDTYDQFFYGPDILVAPVWRKGTTKRDVRIPSDAWIDAWTGLEAVPDAVVSVDAPEHKIPIYYRKGSGLDAIFKDIETSWSAARAKAKERPNLAELQKSVK